MCKYSDNTGYECPHENLEDSDYCIFHLQDDKKNVDEFNKGIQKILETEEDSINFNGFYFPPGTSNFSNKHFEKKVVFMNATFSGEADFNGATFSGKSDFNDAKFLGGVYFSGATFLREVKFENAEFAEESSFGGATFSEEVKFEYAKFNGKISFRPTKSEAIIFKYTYFSDNVRIEADLSKCSFANSNIERVDMTDSTWIRVDDKPKKSLSAFIEKVKNIVGISETSIQIWDEQHGDLTSNWKELEGIYRRLKQSYQKYGDNSTAGKFYYQEMECQREQLRGFNKLIKNVFKLCGYGEKPFNVILASVFLIILFAFTYLFGGIEFVGSSVSKVPPNVIDYNLSLNSFGIQWVMNNFDSVLEDFLLCIYTSVITFTTLGYGDVRPIGVSRIFAALEAGLGIIMTALFIFVFTRKMLR